MDAILLHVCCGPCSTVPLRLFREAKRPFVTFFDNPNIHPESEYEQRLAAFRLLATRFAVEVTTGFYEPDAWDEVIGGRSGVFPLIKGSADFATNRARRTARCRACYAFRFERLAAQAARLGFPAIATTLSISPYQFTDLMARELDVAASRHQLTSAFVDYRAYYPESCQRSRELGLYRQNYCGCRYSQEEAALERAARKAIRSAQRVTEREAAAGHERLRRGEAGV
jgi:predicted adenine nucleotide alpha hydrolase (AANH) superfamily ATPase